MTDRYENIRDALGLLDSEDYCERAIGYSKLRNACDPDTVRALLAEMDSLRAALEAAREDAERLDALEALVKEQPDRALLLHHGVHIVRSGERFYAGIGLSNTRRSLRQAIDRARGKENGNG